MVEAGFRFRDDEGVLTTKEMADALGVADSTLRRMEKQGVIDAPERDTANRRKWMKADIPKLKRRLAKYQKERLAGRRR